MSDLTRLVAAIAVILIAGVAAFALLGRSPGVASIGGVSSPSPSVTPSAPAPTLSPQPSPTPIDTAAWPSYTSARYGFSIGHPADRVVRPATRDWSFPADADANPYNTATESFIAPDQSIARSAWSLAVLPGTTADAWLQAYCLRVESDMPCTALANRTVAVTMDGHAGSLVSFAQDTQAFFLVQNRMYVVAIWRPADFIPEGVPRLLQAYLSTMHLLPGGPSPSVTPSPPA